MKKNRIVICIISALAIVVFTFLSTILWYNFFDKNTEEKLIVNQLYISNNAQQVVKQIGIDDSYALNNTSEVYSFSVENTSTQDLSYKLLLHEISPSLLTDGCTQNDLLTRKELIYQLSLNGKVLIKDNMSSIKENIIDAKTIKAGSVNNYELTFWVKAGQKDYLNKHYHYEINLSV